MHKLHTYRYICRYIHCRCLPSLQAMRSFSHCSAHLRKMQAIQMNAKKKKRKTRNKKVHIGPCYAGARCYILQPRRVWGVWISNPGPAGSRRPSRAVAAQRASHCATQASYVNTRYPLVCYVLFFIGFYFKSHLSQKQLRTNSHTK